nr:HAMP domain-containing sensor histidine kinase [Fulvivirga aurantia]
MLLWLLENEHAQLKKTNHELDSFLYSTSHDLRAPVASILGLTNLAKQDVTDTNSHQYFQMIEDSTLKLDETIGNILTLAKSANVAPNITEINIADLVSVLETKLAIKHFNSSVAFIKEYDTPVIKSDVLQLEIILGNILSNAFKYHKPDVENAFVKLSVKLNESHYSIVISDNGQGIDKESLSKIFDMFYRANESSEGTGLGLYIVKKAIDRLEGQISVSSTLGAGTSFQILLPKHLS